MPKDRALRAFDMQDFWESIQLCRQALETDDTQAEYFHLLGRALAWFRWVQHGAVHLYILYILAALIILLMVWR